MKRPLLLFLLILSFPFSVVAQSDDPVELQTGKLDPNSDPELQIFYEKYRAWSQSITQGAATMKMDEEAMINNFIIFSEDGLLMKDLNFHSVESCQKQILENLPGQEAGKPWIYISVESRINKRELAGMLQFFNEQKIDYHFGIEDEFVPKMIRD